MKRLTLASTKDKEVIDITPRVNELAAGAGRDGCVHLFVAHTTAALTTADLDPGTDLDMLDAFEALMPKLPYRHPHDPSHVTDHILASMIGSSLTIPSKNGKLVLGSWQRIVLVELDGPRERTIYVSFFEER